MFRSRAGRSSFTFISVTADMAEVKRYVVRRGGMLLLFDSRYSQYPEKLDTSEFDKEGFEKMEEGRYYEAELSVKIGRKV